MDPLKKEATPIKEEAIEEEFDDQYSGTNSKTTDGKFMIEEARNYDSQFSGSKSDNESKYSIHKIGKHQASAETLIGVRNNLNVSKETPSSNLHTLKTSFITGTVGNNTTTKT